MKNAHLKTTKTTAIATALMLSALSVVAPTSAVELPKGECVVIVASRQTLDEVKNYINDEISNAIDKRQVRVFQSQNGWKAIGVAMLQDKTSPSVMKQWKAAKKIPQDSFCASGQKFTDEIAWNSQSSASPKKITQKDFDFIAANKLETKDLSKYSAPQLRLLRNYFFAKEGFSFKAGSDLDVFFGQFPWYIPKALESSHVYNNLLTLQEKDNVALILAEESRRKEAAGASKTPGAASAAKMPAKTSMKTPPKQSASHRKPPISLKPQKQGGRWGYIDAEANWTIPAQFDWADAFATNGLAAVRQGKQYGFIDTAGKWAIKPQFDVAWRFEDNGLAQVRKDGKYYQVNAGGELFNLD